MDRGPPDRLRVNSRATLFLPFDIPSTSAKTARALPPTLPQKGFPRNGDLQSITSTVQRHFGQIQFCRLNFWSLSRKAFLILVNSKKTNNFV